MRRPCGRTWKRCLDRRFSPHVVLIGLRRLRAEALTRVYGPEIVELFRRVKLSFDPLGIFNPGIILPCPEGPHAGDPPISRLKVGATAAPLPDDLQRSLREIERTGGYGRSRLELAGEVASR